MNAERILNALARYHRLRILDIISESGNEGLIVTAATKLLPVGQSTTTHHLTLMLNAGVLNMAVEGHYHLYRINVETLEWIVNYLNNVITKCKKGEVV